MTRAEEALMASAINNAVKAAQKLIDMPDGGSCNDDRPYISVKGMRQDTADRIQNLCEYKLRVHTFRFHGRILEIVGGLSGQGARQTAMSEHIADLLKQQGYRASVWYQID